MRFLVVGAGALGCELLLGLANAGFDNIDVLDMDTVAISNLCRQFLFDARDVGKPKSEVAVQYMRHKFPKKTFTSHFKRAQSLPDLFYRQFDIVLLGVDNVEVRKWMNDAVSRCSVVRLPDSLTSNPNESEFVLLQGLIESIPLFDTGTEGYKGHCNLVQLGRTACINCLLDLYPNSRHENIPLCSLPSIPRQLDQCVSYAAYKIWNEEQPFGPNTTLNEENMKHMKWIAKRAQEHAFKYGIEDILSVSFVRNVLKSTIPAVLSTNLCIAAVCVTEVTKWVHNTPRTHENYLYFNGASSALGVYAHWQYMKPNCSCVCCRIYVCNCLRRWTPPQLVSNSVLPLCNMIIEPETAIKKITQLRVRVTPNSRENPVIEFWLLQSGLLEGVTSCLRDAPVFDCIKGKLSSYFSDSQHLQEAMSMVQLIVDSPAGSCRLLLHFISKH